MSTKADLVTEKDLSHFDDRVYSDIEKDGSFSFNLEISKDSADYLYMVDTEEDGDNTGLLSIKMNGKMFNSLMNYFAGMKKHYPNGYNGR
jgi:hypothetical protein